MNMDRVANRSLFKSKNNARNKLRNLGGIMSSSESLLNEAVKTIDAPVSRPDMSGIMMANQMAPQPAPPMAPPPMAPQPAPPMAPPPMAPPPMPAPQPQPAPQMAAPQPAPSLNPFGADPKRGFALGGLLNDPDTQARLAANTATPEERAKTNMLGIDVTQQAGTVVERPTPQLINLKEMTREQANRLASDTLTGKTPFVSPFTEARFGDKAPELTAGMQNLGAMLSDPNVSIQEKSRMIAAFAGGNPKAKDMNKEMSSVANKTFGKKLSSNQKLDSMNKSIMGFAIAAGTSPFASVNFANGMMVGLKEMKNTEEGRINLASAARGAGPGGAKSSTYRTPGNAYQDAIEDAMSVKAQEIPDGVTKQQYAEQYARGIVSKSYTPAQLVGTAFEGTSTMSGGGQPVPSGASPTKEEFLVAARTANPNASDADLETYYDNTYG